ncbi:MAG TPA: ABC transporter permease [Solirubrobacteraceae bacterium]|jgi:ABC-2 type transport system permease protein|nr:ABC transporter permease [Solirubrobacteraceae bacterium]
MSVEAPPLETLAPAAAPFEGLGRPIKGPGALTHDWRRFWHLTYNIARNEFKLKFFGSALGYVWQVLNPLLLFGVLYVFFVVISNVGGGGKPSEQFYGVQLLGSIILFTFFNEATSGAVRSVVDRENLVRKIQFPRLVIPLAITLLAFFNLAMNLIVVLIFALISGVQPMLSWLELPLILTMLVLFSTGLAMLLSAMFVHFRDIQPIWSVVSQIVFYSSPVIIPIEKVRAALIEPPNNDALHRLLYHIYMLNPLVTVFQQFRHAMVTHATLSAGEALGSWAALLEPLGVTAAVFALGFWVFNRSAPYVAENL